MAINEVDQYAHIEDRTAENVGRQRLSLSPGSSIKSQVLEG